MSNSETPPDLASTFVVVDRDLRADAIAVTDSFWTDLERRFPDFAGHTLIFSFSLSADWPTWEIHPEGDEVVCLLSGEANMILQADTGEEVVHLGKPGSFLIVPKGAWHTARIPEHATMLFVTSGNGTENHASPGGD
jgi:quercetin dioxygenase-like cupin family protein